MRDLNKYDLDWCVRRLPKSVVGLLQNNPRTLSVAGGFIRSVISGEDVSDVDLFASTVESAKRFAKCLCTNGRHRVETENADTVYGDKYPIQFIHRWTYEKPEDVIESFDYSICAAAFWSDGTNWVGKCHDQFYEDLAAKRLVYLSPVRKEAAGGSLLRVLKYYQRGYRIDMPSLAKVMCRMIQKIEPSKLDDHAFTFDAILGMLREVDPLVAVTATDPHNHEEKSDG